MDDPLQYYRDASRPIEEPVVLVEVEGRAELLDGNHRTGASVVAGRKTIPAIVGRKKEAT